MANTALSNLTGYDPTSLQNTTSLSMFISHSGKSRHVNVAGIAAILGMPTHSLIKSTLVQTFTAADQVIQFDTVVQDPWGVHDANSPGVMVAPFNCVAELFYSIRYQRNSQIAVGVYFAVNSNPDYPGLIISYGDTTTGNEWAAKTGPVFLNSGDLIELKHGSSDANNVASFDYTYIGFAPLRMYVDTDWQI